MQRSSPSIAALATALAKAQIELANPEKSLVGIIELRGGERGQGGARQFRYAPLSSGLEIDRNRADYSDRSSCRRGQSHHPSRPFVR